MKRSDRHTSKLDRWYPAVLAVVCATAAACGTDAVSCSAACHLGDDNEFPSDRLLSELTVDELCGLLVSDRDRVNDADRIRASCYGSALAEARTNGGAGADCEALARACMADPPPPDDRCVIAEVPACATNVTVGELRACTRAQADAINALAAAISCDNVPAPPEPPACSTLRARCPDLLAPDGPEPG